jgi:hypothetical protein
LKVLLDHNLTEHLVPHLTEHEVRTAKEMLWDELRNGSLLRAAEEAGFEVMLTADQNIRYQHNNQLRRIALVVLNTNRIARLMLHTEQIAQALSRVTTGSYEFLEIVPRTRRARRRDRQT